MKVILNDALVLYALSLSLSQFVYYNKLSAASSSKLLVMLCPSASCTFQVLPLRPFCQVRVVAREVPLYGVDWESRVICVERLVLQLVGEAGSGPQLPTRSDSRS